MKKLEIIKKDIKEIDEFNKFGETFKKIYADHLNHLYVFKRKKGYEVVKGKKTKNPDGTIVYCYPSTEDFGRYGYYISGPEDYCKKRIEIRLKDLKGGDD